ncbi:MAG: hypothetical protein EON95_01085 [Caulobacteraceae bacterium]|nr:MAG: hypothetical protein EON95_01085 [Caulobacteraceae bacterium]
MFRVMAVAAAAMLVTACVTPRPMELQNPTVAYKASSKVLVGVVEARERVKGGKPGTFIGYIRMYGAPADLTVDVLTMAEKGKGKTASTYLGERIAAGLKAAGSDVVVVRADREVTDAEANSILAANGGGVLLTIIDRDYHVDINANWVGKFQFNTDFEVIVQKAGKGTVLRKRFAEKAAIQAAGEDSWANQVADATKAKLQQILSDAEVQAALAG